MLLTSLPPVRLGVGADEAVLRLDRPREGTPFPGAAVRRLSLVSVEGSPASTDDLARLPDLLRRPRSARGAHGWGGRGVTP